MKITLLIPLMLLSLPVLSEDNNFWKCHVEDEENQTWTAEHHYQRSAINQANSLCKKESHKPTSCRAAKAACDFFTNGVSTAVLWKCTALDQMSKVWVSNLYPNRDDAVLAARAYCQQKSGFPASCYVNLLTCKSVEGG